MRHQIQRALLLLYVAMILCPVPASAQSNSRSEPIQQSCAGATIPHPEDLSGLWETRDRQEGTFGIHLMLSTEVASSATTLVGTEQKCQDLELIVYRRNPGSRSIEQHSFSDSAPGGDLHYISGRLILHAAGFDLDLHRAPDDAWTGRFHFHDFDSRLTLHRPASPSSTSPWVGTWLEHSDGLSTTCLHIVETSPGQFDGWSDQLVLLGKARFAAGVKKPPSVTQRYGQFVKISASGNRASVQLGADAGICCSHTFAASLEDNDTALRANWPSGPKQNAHISAWRKLSGASCLPDWQ